MKNSEILVLGGGFIGRQIYSKLRPINQVTLASRSGSNDSVTLDLSDLSQTKVFFKNRVFDYVINATGKVDQSPQIFNSSLKDNLLPTLNLLESLNSAGLKRFIHIGSNAEYGLAEVPHSSKSVELPSSPYGVMKLCATKAVLSVSSSIPVTVVRPFSVFGVGMSENTFLFQAIRHAKESIVFKMTDGNQTRDFIPVDCVVDDIIEAGSSESTIGQIVNSCSGSEISLNTVVELIKEIHPTFEVDRSIESRIGENKRSVGIPWQSRSVDYVLKCILELAKG